VVVEETEDDAGGIPVPLLRMEKRVQA